MSWVSTFYGSSIGKKVVVAVTGAIMVLFLIGHMLGNLQVFAGRGPTSEATKLNEYAELLRFEIGILWAIRVVLITTVVVHVITVVRLRAENSAARSQNYALRRYQKANAFSRSMFWGGLALFTYIVYHILHLTAGVAHASLFEHGQVYENVIRSFQNPLIAGVYVLATVFLYFHLFHGTVSLFQTLGVSHPRHLELVRKLGHGLAAVIVLGFASVPIGVLVRVVS
jgi:succinate dehydrogenase / fumarate reductase cytochrome b subunit